MYRIASKCILFLKIWQRFGFNFIHGEKYCHGPDLVSSMIRDRSPFKSSVAIVKGFGSRDFIRACYDWLSLFILRCPEASTKAD